MQKAIGMLLLIVGVASVALAATPEIDPASGVSGLTLLTGAVLVVRARRKG